MRPVLTASTCSMAFGIRAPKTTGNPAATAARHSGPRGARANETAPKRVAAL